MPSVKPAATRESQEPNERSMVIHLRVSPDLWQAVDHCAQDERRTWVAMARILIEDALDQRIGKHGARAGPGAPGRAPGHAPGRVARVTHLGRVK